MLYYSIYLPSYYIFSNIYFQLGKLRVQITFICLLLCSISSASSLETAGFNAVLTKVANVDPPLKTIVIDAGHGGKDSGCLGHHSQEKHIALDISLMLGEHIKSNFPDIKVIYTRTTDVFVPLNLRAKVANKNNADLFISIHCNSFPQSNVRGTETYVMGLHKAEENLKTAKRENASLQFEEDYDPAYDDFDPESPEGHIFLSMYQNENLDNSIAIAAEIEHAFSQSELSKSRGVKQAGFYVLRKATMPSILVETGYLTNSHDEKFLRSNNGKRKVVEAIVNGLARYIDSRKNAAIEVQASQDAYSFRDEARSAKVASAGTTTQSFVEKTTLTPKKKKKKVRRKKSVVAKKQVATTQSGIYTHAPAKNAPPRNTQEHQNTHKQTQSGIYTHAPARSRNVPKPASTVYTPVKNTQNNYAQKTYSSQRTPQNANPANTYSQKRIYTQPTTQTYTASQRNVQANASQNTSQVIRSYSGSTTATVPRNTQGNNFYSIQIAATREPCNPIVNMGLKDIPYTAFYEAGLYKYISGHFTNMQEAIDYKLNLVKKGVKGAFLVRYDENIQRNIEKAKEIAKEQ